MDRSVQRRAIKWGRITRGRTLKALAAAALLLASVAVGPVLASHDEVSLPGSDFEIDTDANIMVDDPDPSIDWGNVDEIRRADSPSGSEDESFGNGTKENTAVPTVVDGSIPPNKSDLKFFGIYQEGGQFVHLFWSRVQDPSGTTNMDFEFNQEQAEEGVGNGVTPLRTEGDLLITYDLSRGGTSPSLSLREWNGSSWGPSEDLTASGNATGSINTSTIEDEDSDGLGEHSPRTFGEASIDLDQILPTGECSTFGSAYLKSRASDSFTSALKDFVPPEEINITNCGSVEFSKVDDADTPLEGAEFTLYEDDGDATFEPGTDDPIATDSDGNDLVCQTDSSGTCTVVNVFFGDYWVDETVVPAGHDKPNNLPQKITVSGTEALELGPFVNPRQAGAILVTKTRKHAADGSGDHPHEGVDFTVNGVTKTTDANGEACFDGLLFDDYTVSETVPTGYAGEDDKTVTVDNAATCSDATYGGESVSFSNTPLSDITVSFESQVTGGTAATIECTDLTANPEDTTPNDFDDTSETFEDLEPGTYDCTVVIDP